MTCPTCEQRDGVIECDHDGKEVCLECAECISTNLAEHKVDLSWWPEWLTAPWLAVQWGDKWYGCTGEPYGWDGKRWLWPGEIDWISDQFLDFTFPPLPATVPPEGIKFKNPHIKE